LLAILIWYLLGWASTCQPASQHPAPPPSAELPAPSTEHRVQVSSGDDEEQYLQKKKKQPHHTRMGHFIFFFE
jgi:hypothetical protein